MNEVYDELDALKEEIEKLKEECRAKKELSESLRKAHNEQIVKFEEANSLIEKQVQQLNAKSDEISEARKICEDLKSSLHEKELLLKQLQFVTEKLQLDYGQKIQKLEGENMALVLDLDKETTKTQSCEKKIVAGSQEIEGLKRQLLITQKKLFQAEEKGKVSEELRSRDDVILKIEEENRNVHDKLKWKREQFRHLEEAHKRLQDQFHLSNLKWEREKSDLFEEIGSLQTSLDSRIRISESRHSQLKTCNQALSHEESRRNILEVEAFELKLRFENVTLECQDAKSKIGDLILERDKDIAELRNALGNKETLTREMEYRISLLEQDNQELVESLKEIREAQIKNSEGNSSEKLQNRLRVLEQLHKKCSADLEEKEAEWRSQLEKMKGDMNGYASDLKEKENEIKELQMELDGCHFLFEVQNEDISVVTMVLKSEFSAAYSMLGKQLENRNSALSEVYDYHEFSSFLSELKEKVVQMDNALEKGSKAILYAFERANDRLAKKILDMDQTKLELQKWKSTAEKANAYLEGNQQVLRQEIERLHGIVKEQVENIMEKDSRLEDLSTQVIFLEQNFVTAIVSVLIEKQIENDVLNDALEHGGNLKFEIRNKNNTIDDLGKEINDLRQKLTFQTQSLKSENQSLLEDIKKVYEERGSMVVQMEGVCNWISDFSSKDVELIHILDHILRNCESSNSRAMDLASDRLS